MSFFKPVVICVFSLWAMLPAFSLAAQGRLSLDGEWHFRTLSGVFVYSDIAEENAGAWQTIETPANWYKQGIDHSGTAVYKKTVQLPTLDDSHYAILSFEGVDYAADIWVNGTHVGSHEGYFQAFSFDVAKQLKAGENTIHVAVHSPREDISDIWSLRKQLIKGIFNHHDTRPGGAWSDRGQDQNTGGIWASSNLRWGKFAGLEKVHVHPTVEEKGEGTLQIAFNVEGPNPGAIKAARFHIAPLNFDGREVTIERSLGRASDGRYQFEVKQSDIALWWPFELGAPNLYKVRMSLVARGEETDSVQRTYAYRTVERETDTGHWRINGVRYFLRGTNYIPTQWLSEMSVSDYEDDLSLMRVAHINIVRVHAHIGAQPFYDAADRSGMLVWQDFPLQWGYDDGDGFLAEAKRQATDMVEQFNHHPSIIAWSMQNEPPWDADWMKYKYDNYDPEQNKRLTNDLYEVVAALDTSRYTHSHSATAEHPWLGWYSGDWTDYAKPTDQSLVTEFGAQALPVLSSLRRIFPQDAIWPDSDEDWKLWNYHNFQKHELTNIAGVEIGDSVEEFIDNTQTYQAVLTKFAAETLRRQKYNPVGGIFQFMFNEDWPSVNWGIVDYWRTPKPGFHSLKTAYQPLLASLYWDRRAYKVGDRLSVEAWIINDLPKGYDNARYEISLRQPDGALAHSNHTIKIEPDSAVDVAKWEHSLEEPGEYSFVLRVLSESGEELSVNDYSLTVLPADSKLASD